MLPQVELACKILDGSCFRDDPSKTIAVQAPRLTCSSCIRSQRGDPCLVHDCA